MAQSGAGDAGIQGHDTEWDRRCWSLGTQHRVGQEMLESSDMAQTGAGDAGVWGHGTEWGQTRYCCLGTQHTALAFSMAVSEPCRVMLGSCRDLILREPGQLPGPATTVFPNTVLGIRSGWPGTSAALGEHPPWGSRVRAAGPDRHETTSHRCWVTMALPGQCWWLAVPPQVAGISPPCLGSSGQNSQGRSGPVKAGDW